MVVRPRVNYSGKLKVKQSLTNHYKIAFDFYSKVDATYFYLPALQGFQVKIQVEHIPKSEALLHDKRTPPVTHIRVHRISAPSQTSYAGD